MVPFGAGAVGKKTQKARDRKPALRRVRASSSMGDICALFPPSPLPLETARGVRHTRATRTGSMEGIAKIVCGDGLGLARAPRVRRAAPRDSRPFSRRAASVPPPGATRRGWGDTDGRFSRLDRRGEERRDDRDDAGRNISFQELRKRQDREQRKVSTPSSRRRPCVLIYPLGALSRVRARSHVRRSPSRSPADRSSSRIPP